MKRRQITILLCIALVAVLNLGNSCASNNNHDEDWYGRGDGYRTDGYRGGGGGYYGGDGYRGGDGGHVRPSGIPREALRVAEDGGKVYWKADSDGIAYVLSVDDRTVPWSGRVRRGDAITVAPGDDAVYIGDRVAWHGNLKRDSRHQIFFDREGRGTYNGGGAGSYGGAGGSGGNWSGGELPRDARRVTAGRGDLVFRAADNGRVYVWDRTDGRMIYRGNINRGQELTVSPGHDFIQIEGKKTQDRDSRRMNDRHDYEVYFDR